MDTVSVRYIVDDVDAAIAFYEHLGFETAMHPAPEFAMLRRDESQRDTSTADASTWPVDGAPVLSERDAAAPALAAALLPDYQDCLARYRELAGGRSGEGVIS
jgi:catechol 2,3-dioxygenase-like lactoylglutathione lyase family enzyme